MGFHDNALWDDVVAVSEARLLEAVRLALDGMGLVVEPAGAAGLAAARSPCDGLRGKLVATILCGGNVSREQLERWFLQ